MSRPRIRSIKPEIWRDEKYCALSRDARLLFIGLMSTADDEGRRRARPAELIGDIYPDDEDVTARKLTKWLGEIEAQSLILVYESAGTRYVAIRHFRRHQWLSRPAPSGLPPPPDPQVVEDNSVNPRGDGSENSKQTPNTSEGNSSPHAQARVPDPVPYPDPDPDPSSGNTRARSADVRAVFDAWVDATDKDPSRTQLSNKRRRLIRAALDAYPLDDVLAAVRGWRHSAHHRGENDRRTVYNAIELLLRDADRIEHFRDLELAGPPTPNGNGRLTHTGDLSRFDRLGDRSAA